MFAMEGDGVCEPGSFKWIRKGSLLVLDYPRFEIAVTAEIIGGLKQIIAKPEDSGEDSE